MKGAGRGVVRTGDGGITRTARAQAATASEPFSAESGDCTCGGPAVSPPKKTVREQNDVRLPGRRFSYLSLELMHVAQK